MHEISKFQMITIVIIALFIFAIGALYSNTRDVMENRAGERDMDNQIEQSSDTRVKNNIANKDRMELQSLSERVSALEQRPEPQPQNRADNFGDFNLRCKIQGIVSDGNIVYMSEDDAVQEAKANDKDLIIRCSY